MWPDRVSNLGPLALESDALLTLLCGPVSPVGVGGGYCEWNKIRTNSLF